MRGDVVPDSIVSSTVQTHAMLTRLFSPNSRVSAPCAFQVPVVRLIKGECVVSSLAQVVFSNGQPILLRRGRHGQAVPTQKPRESPSAAFRIHCACHFLLSRFQGKIRCVSLALGEGSKCTLTQGTPISVEKSERTSVGCCMRFALLCSSVSCDVRPIFKVSIGRQGLSAVIP